MQKKLLRLWGDLTSSLINIFWIGQKFWKGELELFHLSTTLPGRKPLLDTRLRGRSSLKTVKSLFFSPPRELRRGSGSDLILGSQVKLTFLIKKKISGWNFWHPHHLYDFMGVGARYPAAPGAQKKQAQFFPDFRWRAAYLLESSHWGMISKNESFPQQINA